MSSTHRFYFFNLCSYCSLLFISPITSNPGLLFFFFSLFIHISSSVYFYSVIVPFMTKMIQSGLICIQWLLCPKDPSWIKELTPLAEGYWLMMVDNSIPLQELSSAEGSYLVHGYTPP